MTVDYCRKICSDGKFKYYGVEVIKIRIYIFPDIFKHQLLVMNCILFSYIKWLKWSQPFCLQAGHQCFCGNKLTKSDKKKDSECMNPCRGDREQACGGGWRIAIYQNPNFKPSTINLNQSNVYFRHEHFFRFF